LSAQSSAATGTAEKLAQALRSYSIVVQERDDLAAQSAKLTAAAEAAASRREPTRPAPAAAPSAPTRSAPVAASPPPATAPARTHTIAAGDTLTKISQQYYGAASRWPEILAANRDVLRSERDLIAGRVLRIP
jgi:nucleoid-associated protein YgaU